MLKLFFITLFTTFLSLHSYAQHRQEKIDSIYEILPELENDSLRIITFNNLSAYYQKLDTSYSTDSALYTIKRSYELAIKKRNHKVSNYPFITYSELNKSIHNYDLALKVLLESLDISRSTNNVAWEAEALENIIHIFRIIDDHERKNEYRSQLKKVVEKMDRSTKKASYLNSLGTFYAFEQFDPEKQIDSSLYFYKKALNILLEEKDSLGISYSYNNIGRIHEIHERYDEALKYYLQSLSIKRKMKNIKSMASTNINIGRLYLVKKEYRKGITHVKKGIQQAKESNNIRFQKGGYIVLYKLQKETGDYKASLEALEKVREIESKIQNKEQIELARELERKYNAEKLEQEAKINALELENSKVTLSRQKNVIWFLAIGVIIFILLVVLILINYRQKRKINRQLEVNNILLQKQKLKTEEQNMLLVRKNKEITDSINYAKRIQEAILPSRYTISENIKNGFIMFKPKDVVSGDFYWMEENEDKLFLAAADCTGHGVPGAMVSVICSNALSKALLEEKIEDPAELLNRTREIVINQFEKSSDHVKDGMDISLAVIDKKNNTIEWAGANNPLWIIRNEQKDRVEEFRPDKQPVGAYHRLKKFTSHQIKVSKNDKIYMFSDGFVDQFGGKSNKKFKPAQFRKLLLEIQELSMKEQKSALKYAFEEWRGDNEQVDDVCVIGYEI